MKSSTCVDRKSHDVLMSIPTLPQLAGRVIGLLVFISATTTSVAIAQVLAPQPQQATPQRPFDAGIAPNWSIPHSGHTTKWPNFMQRGEYEHHHALTPKWPQMQGRNSIHNWRSPFEPQNGPESASSEQTPSHMHQGEPAHQPHMDMRGKYPQNMQLHVVPHAGHLRNVLPVDAVVRRGAESFVFLRNGDRFDRTPVHVKYRDQHSVVVENDESLFPGDVVARGGAHQMQMLLKNEPDGDVVPHAGHSHKSVDDVPRTRSFADEERLAKNDVASSQEQVASSQEQLAQLYVDYGHYEDAIAQLEIVLEYFDGEHSDQQRYANASNRLARVQLELGRYAKAKEILDENVKRLSGSQSDATDQSVDLLGDTLALLAELCRETGDFKQAESLHPRILKRRSDVFGEEHREYAVALHNYGIFKWRQERFQYAEELLRRELQLTEQLSPASRELAHSRESLALALTSQGKLVEAETLFEAALQTYESLPGNDRDRYRTLSNLAFLHIFDGKFDEALALFSEAASGRKSLLGEDHLDYADTLADEARLRLVQGKLDIAIEVSRHALAITRKSIESTSTLQSERQQLAMANLFRERLDLLLTAAEKSPQSAEETFEEILNWKGSTLVRQRMMRKLSQQDSIASKYIELQQVTMRIASLSRSPPPETDAIENWKAELMAMSGEKESLEAELSQASVEFRSSRIAPTLEKLAQALPGDSALIDYFAYASLSPDPEKGRFNRTPSLMASVVKPDGSVQCVHFGLSEPIAKLIDVWRDSLGWSPQSRHAGRKLRAAIWEPLLPLVGDAKTILVSTDGPLGRLPFVALPGRAEGSYLIEDHRIAMVPVPQMIPSLVAGRERHKLPKHLLVMGDVDYGDPNRELLAVNKATLPWDRGGPSPPRSGSDSFARLEHTAGEIAAIERLYRNQGWSKPDCIVTLDRGEATEERFREFAPQCYQIHLATHGFFAAPSFLSANSSDMSRTESRLVGEDEFSVRGVSPGLLSGLAFSGANAKPQPNGDDGILTADEIASLPLDGVELVVLSACETGLGEVAGGEGLIGIQRSFQVSGARTTIASLWKVPDLATRLLMEQFYKNYWGQEEMSRLDAMREAQLWVLRHPDDLRGVVRDVQELKERKTPPKYWGAFTLSGDWR
ncbi:CHAT domain-containing protein [Rhodopirellula sp. SWK7]|uniref:CHAT domain-containing protein n=1 Tax=Rhodopirellula sp. SWK7 TaxID=595460 RepID=UPI001181B0D8|nr:CHAT domain-containing protein [Rhodopirellula sp. SWK7]